MSNEFDVIFHWGELHSWLGSDWKKHFSKDTEEITMPKGASMSQEAYRAAIFGEYGERPIHTALTRRGYARSGVRIGVMGFSQTCIGATVLLMSKDGGMVDFAFANDGIHRGVEIWSQFGSLAAYGATDNTNITPTERMCVITHSQTARPGPNIPSTSETAAEIAKRVMSSPVPTNYVPIPELIDAPHDPVSVKCSYSNEVVVYNKVPGSYATNVGNFYVFGYENMGKTCTDHIYQSKVIGPRVLKHLLIPRWNNNDRNSGSCVVT